MADLMFLLIPRGKKGILVLFLELKWKEKLSDVELEKWSNEALKQIGELRYDSEMKRGWNYGNLEV